MDEIFSQRSKYCWSKYALLESLPISENSAFETKTECKKMDSYALARVAEFWEDLSSEVIN